MKKLKGVLFGDPGSGKSYFVNQFPKRFFICTDGNYEWLPNAKDEDHIQIDSWSKFKDINMKMDFSGYDCIVVDLLEDLFDWCKYETCKSAGVKHVSELGDYGKGYDIVYTNFLAEIFKLLAKDKSVFLICHGRDTTTKDEFGISHDYHTYTSFLPDKVVVPIEGRCRFFLRVFKETEIDPDTKRSKTKHYLSFRPHADEFGINRGEYDDNVPDKIPLNMKLFLDLLGFYDEVTAEPVTEQSIDSIVKAEPQPRPELKEVLEPKPEVKAEPKKKKSKAEKQVSTEEAVNIMDGIFEKFGIKTETAELKAKPEENVEAKAEEPKLVASDEPVQLTEPVNEAAEESNDNPLLDNDTEEVPQMSIDDIMKMLSENGGK